MSDSIKKTKKSFVAGSLASSAGIFISKAIGLFYVIPFVALAGEANKAFYTVAYTYYRVLLQICSAGLPFAVAAIIAKYSEKEDYKTVMVVRKLSMSILATSGLITAFLFICSSKFLATSALANKAPQDVIYLRNTFIILSFALFLVPVLYAYRGFYQGLKYLKLYARSQIIEQFVRVGSLLFLGWLAVEVLHLDRIFAVYSAVFAASLGALVAIFYFREFDKRHIGPIQRAARAQTSDPVPTKQLLKELFAFGVPFLLGAIFGNSQQLINNQFFIKINTDLGMDYELARNLLGIMELNCDKLTSIPQVLGLGFSSGIVPYMTVSLEERNFKELRKNIYKCLDTVNFIAIPVCVGMSCLARPLYYVMYGNVNLTYGAHMLRYSAFLGLMTTLTPMVNSLLMTLHLKKEAIGYLAVGFTVKAIAMYPMIQTFGYTGAITSSILCSAVIYYLSLAKIKNKYHCDYSKVFKHTIRIVVACLAMNGSFVVLRVLGLSFSETSRLLAILMLALYTVVGMITYFVVANAMKLPEGIFDMRLKDMLKALLARKKKVA